MTAPLELTRAQILAFRRRTAHLDERLPPGAASYRRAAWAGLQDSMPRAALLSLHARVAGVEPTALDHPSLVQVWGPRYSTYVVAARDRALFTLGRLPEAARARARAEEMAARAEAILAGRRLADRELGLGNRVRYGATTGTLLIRWDGARAPLVWAVPRPEVEPRAARRELARRYLHVFGPATAASFGTWAGVAAREARDAFDALDLVPVRTPIGDGWILAKDEAAVRAVGDASSAAAVRLLPSGDTFTLLQGADRELLVPDARLRAELWTPRVWPGAVLVGGEIAGTWRRAGADLAVQPWRRLTRAERDAVEAEAAALPLPGLEREIAVRWDGS
ncbi:MAG TPA: crosslink repair DNA glycosylase YcaQ family protein [Gaiellaceae bacterium]|nr:crosslink repair DNA glycosylase YcaQ family protein [Gaiellaceae bacterium]